MGDEYIKPKLKEANKPMFGGLSSVYNKNMFA
jgi:hypothetical protein